MARFNSGWVKLHRELLEKDISQNVILFAIWHFLLLAAVYKETQLLWNGKQKKLQPGQAVIGIRELAQRWDISSRTVHKWLDYLEKTGRIVKESCTRGTIVTICNWDVYQISEDESFTQSKHEVNAEETQSKREVNVEETRSKREVNLSKESKKERNKEEKKERRKDGENNIVGIRPKYPQEFEDLWLLYERRGDKKAAFGVYKQLKLNGDALSALKTGIRNYVRSTPELKYRKHFERFLKTDWMETAEAPILQIVPKSKSQEIADANAWLLEIK
jgi:DNA-binding transcriptional regulator YhcF (GntR family)